MLSTQGYATGGAIATQGYGSTIELIKEILTPFTSSVVLQEPSIQSLISISIVLSKNGIIYFPEDVYPIYTIVEKDTIITNIRR